MLTVLCLLTAQLADIIIKNVLHLKIGSAVQAILSQQPREELHTRRRTVFQTKSAKSHRAAPVASMVMRYTGPALRPALSSSALPEIGEKRRSYPVAVYSAKSRRYTLICASETEDKHYIVYQRKGN